MKLLPPPACNFIFAPRPQVPKEEIRRFMFWYVRNHTSKNKHLLGSFDGNPMIDRKFYEKLLRIRGLLNHRGIHWEEANCILHEQELIAARRLTLAQKKQRKLTQLDNVYSEELNKINGSSDLFKTDKIAELDRKYKLTLDKINETYHPDKVRPI